MFSMSFGSLVICFLSMIILTLYICFTVNRSHGLLICYLKPVFILSVIIMLRMLIPINFPFTYSIYGTKIMNTIGTVIYLDITESLTVFDIFLIFWFAGAFIQIIRYIVNRKTIFSYIKPYILSRQELKNFPYNYSFDTFKQNKMQVACVPENVGPSIFGIIHPIIILPKDNISSHDLHFVLKHEIQHYRSFDLHLKIILDLLIALHWWNPFVYILRRNYNTAIEFSNDYMVSKQLNNIEKAEYAKSLLNIAKMQFSNRQFDLSVVGNTTYLKRRISILVDDNYISKNRKTVSLFLNVMFISTIMIVSLFFVPEADYSTQAQEVFEEEDAFSITTNNAYFIKSPDGYKLYMNGEYITTITDIPEDLKEVSIHEEENIN